MGNLIDPVCGQTVESWTSVKTARHCGGLTGVIIASIISLICAIVFIVNIIKYVKVEKTDPRYKQLRQKYLTTLIIVLLVGLLSWVLVPIFGFFSKRKWQSIYGDIESMEKQGMSKTQALEKLAADRRQREQSRAMLGAAALIGGLRR